VQIFQENDRSYPAQVVAAQIRTLLYKHEGCTSFLPSPRLKSYFVSFGTWVFCEPPWCYPNIKCWTWVCRVDLYCSESNLWCVFDL